MDVRFPDVDAARVREAAMRLQHGGVGFYPGANFVHVDVGSVRAWPRMTREQLARLFPDGKTIHLPLDGNPLPGYEQARAEIMSRGSTRQSEPGPPRRSLWAGLFAKQNGAEQGPVAALADDALAYAPLPPPRPNVAPAEAEATHALLDADLASLRLLFSRLRLASSPGPRARSTTVKVTAHSYPADTDLTHIVSTPPGHAEWTPSAHPEMDEALKELARALGARAKTLGEQHTSATMTGSITGPVFAP